MPVINHLPVTCDHKFVYARQEEKEEGGYRPIRHVYDVFFCEKCLEYKGREVAQWVPNGFDSGYTKRSLI
jgi:hypothetical protein